ncbi:hypothetical protein GMMP1_540071 [Candidatus Magnetomoraceae bacterium gMMP-1]
MDKETIIAYWIENSDRDLNTMNHFTGIKIL